MTTKENPNGAIERASKATSDYGIVAFSHLRWHFVWQRPQQFLSRFAQWHPVLFVEEPIWDLDDDQRPALHIERVNDRIHIAVPRLPKNMLWEDAHDELRRLTRDAIEWVNADGSFNEPLHWYYSPMMAEWALGHFPTRAIVYDCMDELSQFRGAPASLVRNETRLVENADVVFTGGYNLFEKKSRHHGNVHCFGCGVEYDHFAKAQDASTPIPPDIADLPRPIVGWFGVIDERVDYDLLREAASLRPNVSFVLVGPVVKVDPESLPQAPNLHWLGGRAYEELPAYCRAFDVCMMCFALNEATEFINPTKALEYLATGKPVISTPVRDVVRQYEGLVTIVDSPDAFVRAIDRLTEQPDAEMIRRGIEKARTSSWEGTVAQMREIIGRATEAHPNRSRAQEVQAATAL